MASTTVDDVDDGKQHEKIKTMQNTNKTAQQIIAQAHANYSPAGMPLTLIKDETGQYPSGVKRRR